MSGAGHINSENARDEIDSKIESDIEKLIIGNREFFEVEREFQAFCPFEAFGVVRAEIRHSSFLSYVMNPYKPHGFGSRILRDLLMTAAKVSRGADFVKSEMSPLDVHLLELDQADVRREWNGIDLLITLKREKVIIAVELKIDSSQHSDQLRRYRNLVEKNWPPNQYRHVYIFLTKFDETPEDAEFWLPVRIHDFVVQLEETFSVIDNDSDAFRLLRSYLQMLRRNHLSNPRLEDIARRLWLEHGEALDFLMSRRPDALADIMAALNNDIAALAKENKLVQGEFVPDQSALTVLRLGYQPWDDVPGFLSARWTDSRRLILFEVKREANRISAFMYLGPGTTPHRAKLADALKSRRLHRPTAKAGEEWMCLAKKQLYEIRESSEATDGDPIKSIRLLLREFLNQAVPHFDFAIREASKTA